MKKAYKHSILFAGILVIVLLIFGFKEKDKKTSLNKPTTNDYYNFISINEILMWVSNNGDGSHDPYTDGSGFYWPGGENAVKAAIYEDGLVWGGFVVDSIRVNGNTHFQGLQAGKILNDGNADDPNLSKYKVYKILKGWENLIASPIRDQYEQDFNEWPVDDGAPWIDVNGDDIYTAGIDSPQYVGDETMWYVANDLDTARSLNTYGSLPIGLEFQTTIWGFKSYNFLADVVFKKYRIINKGQNTIDSMYLAYWADDDLGDATDDCVGCDTVLSLGYTYNGDNQDGDGTGIQYGLSPPAVGHMIIQGPIVPATTMDSARFNNQWIKGFKNLPMTSFIFHINGLQSYPDPQWGSYQGTIEFYNYLSGLAWDGTPFINPHTGAATKFVMPGDPTLGAAGGWHQLNWPGGPIPSVMRNLPTSGSFTMASGDTQEVVIAIFMAQGTDHLNSVTELKNKAVEIHHFYGNDYITKVDNEITKQPYKFKLEQNYPNPFNPTTTIEYSIPKPGKVELIVYDILGREVAKLVNETKKAGKHEISFDGSNYSSGLYFYNLNAGDKILLRKMLLIK